MLILQRLGYKMNTHRHITSPYFQLLSSVLDIDFNVRNTTVFKKHELQGMVLYLGGVNTIITHNFEHEMKMCGI